MATVFDEFGNIVEIPDDVDQTSQQNRSYITSGGANDDNPTIQKFDDGSSVQTFDDGSTLVTDSEGNLSSSPSIEEVNAGSTIAGKSGSPSAKTKKSKPGKRLQNPLGNFSSYTYQITLYMITPEAYDAFIESGRKDINAISNTSNQTAANDFSSSGAGVYIVAQSGGINNTTTLRAPGFNLDYYIDELQIKTATSGQSSGTSSNTTYMTFKIFEPYGFSFVNKLKNAAQSLQNYSSLKNYKNLENPSKQFFMLGIQFQGYDKDGNPLKGDERESNTTELSGGSNGVFERFYDILITSIKFKLDGRTTVYTISAATTAPQTAYGTKRGRLLNDVNATCSTVEEALIGDGPGINGIFTQLNQQQIDMKNAGSIEIPNKFNVKFIGDTVDLIKNASVISKFADPDKTKWPSAPVKDSNQINEKVSVKSTPDNTKRIISFKSDTPIQQLVQLIISQSEYVENALKVLYTTSIEPDQDSDSPEDVKPKSNRRLSWYNMSAEIKNLGFDKKVNDFAYEITYIIQPYETPVVMAVAAGATTPYYGPHKRYDYWFTGENSEILEYSQVLDNTYFNTAIESTGSSASTGGATDIPMVAGKRQNVQRQGKLGIGAEAQNSYVNYLIDPGNYASAKISILGDPDFLVQESSSSINELYNQFYGTDGFTINPNGGQVFIEIDFKEGVDYNNQTGTMDINESIVFWKYPSKIKKVVKGISYRVIEVTSNFSKGKFTQDLNCAINTFPDVDDEPNANTGSRESSNSINNQRSEQQQGAGQGNNPTGSNSTGLMQDDATGVDEAVERERQFSEADQSDLYYYGSSTNNQMTSPTGGGTGFSEFGEGNMLVADDDASYGAFDSYEDEGGRET